MKICLRRSQTCCGGMYLCSDNTISFAKAKLHFRCLSPASIFLESASSNNAAPAEKTDEIEMKFFLSEVCVCLFLSTSSNVLAVFVPDRQIQQFSRGNFNSSAVNILLNNFALLQSPQYWRLKLEIVQKKSGKSQKFSKSAPDWFLFLFDLGIDLEAEAPAFHEKYSKICFLQKC